ncbi:ATP-dependent RNA helicase TDRD9-like [Watersipora subatra]|uniref:ATP-dependent RNA helicase TDRD9-like n=1 Tax=Watersipora subatra TaxID=2589382 RepID=UPI00355B3B9E
MPRHQLRGASTLDDIDDFFSIKPHSSSRSSYVSEATERKPDRIRGRMIDEHGNPITAETYTVRRQQTMPSYQLESARYRDGKAYVQEFKKTQADSADASEELSALKLDDTATLDRLETSSMTGSTVSTMYGQLFNMPIQDAKVAYKGYRQTVYSDKLPITSHREKLIQTIESTQVTIIEGMTGCGKTTQVPQYILDEYAKAGRRCKIAVTQPRRIAAISIAKRVCKERGWQEGTYCGYQVARDTKLDLDKTMITYMTTGILLQKLIKERSLNTYTHIILDEVHERDQDTDLALLIVKRFIHSVSPTVKIILMSATFDCRIFADYFATEIRGRMQRAPVYEIEGRGYSVKEIYWSDPPCNNMIAMPKFDEAEPAAHPSALALVVKLLYEFDKIEQEEQKDGIAQGKPVSRGSVLIFLPGLAEIQDLHALLVKEAGLKDNKLTMLPLHSSITLEEQSRVFETPHVFYRKVILSTNIAESSITVPDIKYVIDFCLTKCLQTDPETNMTCLRMEWASKANCKQRMGRAGRVSNGRVYRLVHRNFYVNHLLDYGAPEMTRCPLSQLVRVKKLGPEEPRAILSSALDPPDMNDIGKSILLLKEAGALANPKDMRRYNPFDGELTFVGEVLSSLPLSIELGKLLVFGHLLGLLPECLIIAASMHTRTIFRQPFMKKVDAFRHKLRWDRGMHSDPIATVNAYKEWDRLKSEDYFMQGSNKENKWCHDHFLQKKTLQEVKEVIGDLTRRLEQHDIRPKDASKASHTRKGVALACAFYPHYFGHQAQPEQDALRTLSGKSPLNTVYMNGFPNNQGILYKRQVEKMLGEHLPGSRMHASFENTKCYVEFERAAGDCSVIPNAMYVSLLLRLQRERLQLKLYDDDQASEMMRRINDVQREAAMYEGRLDTNRMSASSSFKSDSVKSPAVPNGSTTIVELVITYVEECGHFWGQRVDSVKMNQLTTLQNFINQPDTINQSSPMLNPVVEALCIAPYCGDFYRGRVKAVSGESVQVHFIDYGNTELVSVNHVKQLLPQFRQLEPLAMECALAHLKPPNPSQGWPPQVNEIFSQMVLYKQVYCKIYSFDQGVLRLDKMADVQSQHIGYHEILISKNMASPGTESFTSQQNHKLRYSEAMGMTNDMADVDSWGFGVESEIGNLNSSTRRQNISGPFSPLELRFFPYAAVRSMKQVKVETSSVNAMALDEMPNDTHNRLMVAAGLSVNPSSSKIIARETTLMPNIHGLPSLMCLLFAPSIQIRRDDQKNSYTGALCGLGQDPRTGGSAFPDHDIEMTFDTQIDVEDLIAINSIRMSFNYCLGGANMEMFEFQTKIRKILLDLLNRERPSREKVFAVNSLTWTRIDEWDVLRHGLEDTIADSLHLFRLIDAPVLETALSSEDVAERERLEGLSVHVQSLTKIAGGRPRPLTVDCELCHVRVTSQRELVIHMQSKTHRANDHDLHTLLQRISRRS